MKLMTVLALLSMQTAVYAQEDTASVTYIPGEGIYLLHYNLLGVSYTDTLVPATRIDPVVVCSVGKEGEMFVFSYAVSLMLTSQQYLSSFMVSHPAPILNPTKPNARWSQGEFAQYKVWDWSNSLMDPSGLWTPTTDVAPGGSTSGFSFRSAGQPTIVKSYLEGNAPLLAFTAEPPQLLYDLLNTIDVFPHNTVVRRTLGPADPPTPFNGLGFLDTIKSYITESRTLNWITTQATADKYTALINSAQAHLSSSPPLRGTVKAKLDSVLVNVYPDSAAALITSEAYALLRFNTEYVLKKLREEDEAYATDNTSSSSDATATNNARHLARTPTREAGVYYLHEVFTSGGEVFYRRSQDEGNSWEQTHRITTTQGENSHPCLTATQSHTLHIVWQRRSAPSTYEVWHSRSTNKGATWSTPALLPDADNVEASQYQTGGAMPVVAEWNGSTLLSVYCSSAGLRYRTSEDDGQSWHIPDPEVISGYYNDRVESPSVAGGGSTLSLVYGYVDVGESPYSRVFDGSRWSQEEEFGKATGMTEGSFPSVAIDGNGQPIAAWHAASSVLNLGKVVVFRAGYADNQWSTWFTAFGQPWVDWVHPSVTTGDLLETHEYGVTIVHHTAPLTVNLLQYGGRTAWSIATLSESGAWADIVPWSPPEHSPAYMWTDQSAFPYKVVAGSGEQSLAGHKEGVVSVEMIHKRGAVVENRQLRSTLMLEFEQMKVVRANGDTSVVPFKASALRQSGTITLMNMWDYLGSDTLHVPADARWLIVSKRFAQRGPVISQRKFFLHALKPDGTPLVALDTTSTSGTVVVNIEQFGGQKVMVRPQVLLEGIKNRAVTIGVGDIFLKREEL